MIRSFVTFETCSSEDEFTNNVSIVSDSHNRMKIPYQLLWQRMEQHFSLRSSSFHGPEHWRRVESNGLRMASLNDADETVVRLFALFHDVERESEGYDPEHGRRAAELIRNIHGTDFQISPSQLDMLIDACKYHNDGRTSTDVTIGTCWDADRLDLPRVGIIPEARYMSTSEGKAWATEGPDAFES